MRYELMVDGIYIMNHLVDGKIVLFDLMRMHYELMVIYELMVDGMCTHAL